MQDPDMIDVQGFHIAEPHILRIKESLEETFHGSTIIVSRSTLDSNIEMLRVVRQTQAGEYEIGKIAVDFGGDNPLFGCFSFKNEVPKTGQIDSPHFLRKIIKRVKKEI